MGIRSCKHRKRIINQKLASIRTETSQKNPPVVPQISQENPSAISEISSENQTFSAAGHSDVTEISQENLPWKENVFKIPPLPGVNPTAVSETPKQGTRTSVSGPSAGKLDFSFYMEVKPAAELIIALGALSDIKLNPKGFGRFDVDEERFEISISHQGVMSYLVLEASGVNKYECRKPIGSKMISLYDIFQKIEEITRKNGVIKVIAIFHIDGSKELSFKFDAGVEVFRFSAESHYERWSNPHTFCEALIHTEVLKEMIPLLFREDKAEKVKVEIMKDCLSICIGQKKWRDNYYQKTNGSSTFALDKKVKAEFKFPYTEALTKASVLAATEGFLFSVVLNQLHTFNLMLRFNLQESGYIAFLTL